MPSSDRRWGGRKAAALTAQCLAEYGDRCHLRGPNCKGVAVTADHVVARNRGGEDVLENLRPACSPCNSARGDMPLPQWRRKYPLPVLAPSRTW